MDGEWQISLHNKYKQIAEYALVDPDVFEELVKFQWHYNDGYASGRIKIGENTKCVLMHRFIMGAKTGQIVDHVNQKKVDNKRNNLRFVTKSNVAK